MEWYYDTFRFLSLFIVWAIPAVLLMLVVLFVVAAPALAVGGVVSGLCERLGANLQAKVKEQKGQGLGLTCSINADCPPGFVCVNGSCRRLTLGE